MKCWISTACQTLSLRNTEFLLSLQILHKVRNTLSIQLFSRIQSWALTRFVKILKLVDLRMDTFPSFHAVKQSISCALSIVTICSKFSCKIFCFLSFYGGQYANNAGEFLVYSVKLLVEVPIQSLRRKAHRKFTLCYLLVIFLFRFLLQFPTIILTASVHFQHIIQLTEKIIILTCKSRKIMRNNLVADPRYIHQSSLPLHNLSLNHRIRLFHNECMDRISWILNNAAEFHMNFHPIWS